MQSGFNPMSMMGGGGGGMGGFGGSPSMGGLSQFLNGQFGNSGAPYEKGGQAYDKYFQQAKGFQNPFFNFGQQGMQGMGDWLSSMKDPSKFINNQMQNYQESPWAKYMQDQAMKTGQNAGSATGLTGSTPLMQQMQQNAGGIASQDMNQWLQNVLGINTQYGQGLSNQMGYGQHAGDMLSQLAAQAGDYMGSAAYGKEYGKQQDSANKRGGLLGMLKNGLFG